MRIHQTWRIATGFAVGCGVSVAVGRGVGVAGGRESPDAVGWGDRTTPVDDVGAAVLSGPPAPTMDVSPIGALGVADGAEGCDDVATSTPRTEPTAMSKRADFQRLARGRL
jgi:hypothetical protein